MKTKSSCRLITVCLFLLSGPLSAQKDLSTPPPVQFRTAVPATENDRVILEAFVRHAATYARSLTPESVAASCLKSPEGFAWVEFRYLECLNIAYELTGDIAYLDLLSSRLELFEKILSKQTDDYLGWYGNPIDMRKADALPGKLIDEIQCSFRAIGLFSRWIELAKSNPDYAEKNRAVIDARIRLLTEQFFPKWDARGFYAQIPGRGGVYHGLDFPSRWDTTLSHEKLSIAADGLLKLHRITGNDLYLKRALEIGAWFKSCLQLKDGHYEWMSWSPAGRWDVAQDKEDSWKTGWIAPDPNAAWYISALSIALNLYQHGLLFSDEDMKRFIATQKTQCWNGDMENPVYRTVAAVTGKWVKGRFLSCQIANYDPVLTKLAFYGPHEAEALSSASSSWKGCANAQDYVREKFIMQPQVAANPQPYKSVGENFLQKNENSGFYNRLNFEVTAPGAVTPLKPSEMPGLL